MKSRILIIDDDLDEANNFKRSLLSWDYDVVGVETSVEKALKKISELQPHLILMNTVLNGEMDGFEIYSKIKENLDIPIVYLIPQPSENILKQVNLKFAYCYLIKPVHEVVLKNTVDMAITNHSMEDIEKNYRNLFENTKDSIIIRDQEGIILDVNPAACTMFGYNHDEFVGKSVKHLVSPECIHMLPKINEKLELQGYYDYEISFLHGDGNEIKAEAHCVKINYIHQDDVLCIVNDVTEQKKVEKNLVESEERYRGLFKYIGSGVAVYSAVQDGEDFIFTDFNNAAEEIDKLEKSDVIGKKVTEVFPNVKDFGLLNVMKRVYKTGKAENFPVTQYQDDRITGWRDNFVYRLPSGEVISVYDDVTERKKVEHKIKNSRMKKRYF